MLSRCPREQRRGQKRNIGGDGDETRTQDDARPSRIPSHARRGRDRRGRSYHAAGGRSSRRHRKQRREAQVSVSGELAGGSNLLSGQPVSELREAPVLIKRTERQARRGGLATLGALPLASVRKAEAGPPPPAGAQVTIRKNICTHCSVGCTVVAEVANGVWIGQEPGWDSPINRGSHCAKGAAVRELVHGDRRLKYPMKLVNGQWTRVSWDTAIDEIGAKLLAIREKSGPDSVYWLGSAKYSNEGAYLCRKFAAFWGTNNVDHQARICHSTTVAGVANTWGYGAMTNSYNDIRNAKTIMVMGG